MFTALIPNSQVRLSATTNTQGLPSHRLSILLSQRPSRHIPRPYFTLTRWPTLKPLQLARRTTLEAFFRTHNSHHQLVEERLAAIRSATPLTEDPAILIPKQLLVESLVAQLRATLKAIARFDTEIAALAPTLPDYDLFKALPGAGPTLAPRLMVAFGEQRDRYASAAEVQMYAGIAPVTESSGKQHWVHWRMQGPPSCARPSSSGPR